MSEYADYEMPVSHVNLDETGEDLAREFEEQRKTTDAAVKRAASAYIKAGMLRDEVIWILKVRHVNDNVSQAQIESAVSAAEKGEK